jgi:hypothetical protein
MDPITIFAVVAPFVKDLVAGMLNKFLPTKTPEQETADKAADLELFKAMSPTGETYAWVNSLKPIMQNLVTASTLMLWGYQEVSLPGGASPDVVNAACVVGFYLFGANARNFFRK